LPVKALSFAQRQGPPPDPRPSAQQRGYDHDWNVLASYHRTHVEPCCRVCGHAGQLVHHVEPVDVAPHRRLDPSNLATLCAGCHAKVHARAVALPPTPFITLAPEVIQ
jgi:5-methylcytosine-specific restriction endonuclease McrA